MIFISLDKQIYMYLLDTSDFYFEDERKIHRKLNHYYNSKIKLNKLNIEQCEDIEKRYKPKKLLVDDENFEEYLRRFKSKVNDESQKENKKIIEYQYRIKNGIAKYKDELYKSFKENKSKRRVLNKEAFHPKKVISMFDSVLTRTLGIKEKELTTDLIVIQTFFFDVLEDLILNGFLYNDEKYVCFTASAGQIRTKKTVFIKESTFLKHKDTLTCGLSTEKININGGVNINKYLAYLALCNSATDVWKRFNINNAIVVNDLKTDVFCEVDKINHETYEIERKKRNIPIEHTDGAGMILPSKSKKSFMARLPWIKGLLVPFDFKKFCVENDNSFKVKDIYGKEWDIVEDKISIIFTKSQFKMHKYYSNWQEYKDNFKKFNCQAAKCNIEENYFHDALFNYQMLQTLTDITEKELKEIAYSTIEDIKSIGTNRDIMLKILGATKENENKNSLQKSLYLYPELLRDNHIKKTIKDKKKSMVNDAKAGKLRIKGKYTFICPDMYAFCEYLFLNEDNPKGLLQDGEVFCSLFEDSEKLDCLRSPHLYREHAIRKNTLSEKNSEWFITKGLYTSIHDPISRILQFDVDGDKSLVCSDKTLVEVAERNIANDNIVPLYYEMAVANKEIINEESIYNGLINAYSGGNIGMISNEITKIWNSDNVNMDVIKYLCMENNFIIDYAKTLYKPIRPKEIGKEIHKYTKSKVPHFFRYAKKKDKNKVKEINNSTVNRLAKIIPSSRISFDEVVDEFNYKYLKSTKNYILKDEDRAIIDTYLNKDSQKRRLIKSSKKDKMDISYVYYSIREEILNICNDEEYVVNVLVEYLYRETNSERKESLWKCFGDTLLSNIEKNTEGSVVCEECGKRVETNSKQQRMCDSCFVILRREYKKQKEREYRKKK